MTAQPLTTKAVADQLDTDPKTLRRFLRSETSLVTTAGKGNRYEFTAREVAGLKKRFAAWQAAQPAKRVAKAKPVKADTTPKSSKARKPVTDTTTARIDALEAGLKARGTHISQH